MPRGVSIEAKPARTTTASRLLASLLPAALSSLLLTLLLWFGVIHTMVAVIDQHFDYLWVRSVLYGSAGLGLFFLLNSIIRFIDAAIHAAGLDKQEPVAPPATAAQFAEAAACLHISPRIAGQAFQLLERLLPSGVPLDMQQDLRSLPDFTDRQIESLAIALPGLCGRVEIPIDVTTLVTVYDLLHHVEAAPRITTAPKTPRGSGIHPSLTTALASPDGKLQTASARDSRFRTRAHFSEPKRRASDYSGPFRRATDKRPVEHYSGPFRRASEQQTASASAPNSSERRIADRRAASPPIPPAPGEEPPSSEVARQHSVARSAQSLPVSGIDLSSDSKTDGTKVGLLQASVVREAEPGTTRVVRCN